MHEGKFVISLDFEIYWGVHDAVSLAHYQQNLLGVRKAIPRLLELFQEYKINATFATVGLLFFENKKQMLANLPKQKPQYQNEKLSPYFSEIDKAGNSELEDPLRMGLSLIQQIKNSGQEIGSHTFSHYYCLEKGQTVEAFKEDLECARSVAEKNGIDLKSIIFPRDQYQKEYVEACKDAGFIVFRGNEKSKIFSSRTYGASTNFRRPFRLADSFFDLSGHNCYSKAEMTKDVIINIPSSRFLRPYSKKLQLLEKRKLKRITDSMSYAAKNKLAYHLWWHPHNFGINFIENFSFLEKILLHYQQLNNSDNFQSINMRDLAEELLRNK